MRSLLVGSALFGSAGASPDIVPGPALANLAHASLEPFVFVAALLAGSQLARIAIPRA
jgi:hypothetical protein